MGVGTVLGSRHHRPVVGRWRGGRTLLSAETNEDSPGQAVRRVLAPVGAPRLLIDLGWRDCRGPTGRWSASVLRPAPICRGVHIALLVAARQLFGFVLFASRAKPASMKSRMIQPTGRRCSFANLVSASCPRLYDRQPAPLARVCRVLCARISRRAAPASGAGEERNDQMVLDRVVRSYQRQHN